jgi:hypothetical protein
MCIGRKMSVCEYFQLGQNVGKLKKEIEFRLEKIENDFILWGTEVDSREIVILSEARRLLFSVEHELNIGGSKTFSELSDTVYKARCEWDKVKSDYKC